MSERASHLHEVAERQTVDLLALIATGGESLLRRPCPGREKLGDGTIAAVAAHSAITYHRIAAFARGDSEADQEPGSGHIHSGSQATIPSSRLIEELSAAQRALAALARLTDRELDTVPPAGSARFCDDKRTREQVLTAMLKHQGHQIDAIRAAA